MGPARPKSAGEEAFDAALRLGNRCLLLGALRPSVLRAARAWLLSAIEGILQPERVLCAVVSKTQLRGARAHRKGFAELFTSFLGLGPNSRK